MTIVAKHLIYLELTTSADRSRGNCLIYPSVQNINKNESI